METVDFGVINEADGKKTVRFFLRNDGQAPAKISKVRPTCGCTAADFDRREAVPGDSLWVDLTYNPFRRPGHFEKAVKIYTEEGEPIRVPVNGLVKASEATLANMFPVDAGSLHLSEKTLIPARALTVEIKTLFIDVYNSSDHPVRPAFKSESPAVETQSFPEEIPPHDKGTVGVYLIPSKETRKGDLEYTLLLEESDAPPVLPTEIRILLTIDN